MQTMIIRWMVDGELEDEHGEFFIVKTSPENYWHDSHELRLQYIICRYTKLINNIFLSM